MSESNPHVSSNSNQIIVPVPTLESVDDQTESTSSSSSTATTTKNASTGRKLTSGNAIPKDKVLLKLILASSKSAEFVFPLITSVGAVTEYVYNNWPEEWENEKENITSSQVLRLIYQGRFLHENVTFLALNLPAGKRTVMHLVPREKLPQLSPDDMEKVPKTSDRSCCCTIL